MRPVAIQQLSMRCMLMDVLQILQDFEIVFSYFLYQQISFHPQTFKDPSRMFYPSIYKCILIVKFCWVHDYKDNGNHGFQLQILPQLEHVGPRDSPSSFYFELTYLYNNYNKHHKFNMPLNIVKIKYQNCPSHCIMGGQIMLICNINQFQLQSGLCNYYLYYINQLMEPSKDQNSSLKTDETLNQILAALEEYYKDRSKLEVWSKIFWILNINVGKEGLLSPQAQKYVNYYLQQKSETDGFRQLVSQHKQIICKIYDICTLGSDSIDEAISSGQISEGLFKKLQKSFQQQGIASPKFKLINFCTSAIALHFCQFLQKTKQSNKMNLFLTNRRVPKIIKRKQSNVLSNHQLLKQIFSQPVILMDGFIDNVKPIIGNYLNIQSLFQVTSRNFRNKKAFLSGFVYRQDGSKQFISKIVNINTIFDSSYAGRQMIQNKLASINLISEHQVNVNQKWSLITCIYDLQPKINAIIQKLPIFLKPKSNGDMLSFCRKQLLPTFKYQITKPGYVQRPILVEYPQIFLNVGKNYFYILSFPNSTQVSNQLEKFHNQNIYQVIDTLNTRYSKVRVGPKSIAVIPSNHYYIICSDPQIKNPSTLVEFIFWNTLPKYQQTISLTIKAVQQKKKLYNNYFFLPLQHIFLDYLSHQYLKTNDEEALQTIRTFLTAKLRNQQDILVRHLKINQRISLEMFNMEYTHRFCSNCRACFFNYCCKIANKRQHICMACSLNLEQGEKIEQVCIFHSPHDLRYPLSLLSIYLNKRRHPSETIQSPYERNICTGQFMGSIQNQNCKGQPNPNTKSLGNFFINYDKKDQIFFSNRLKQLGIVTIEEMIICQALKRPKTNEQKQIIMQKISIYSKQVSDPESIKKIICHKYDQSNLVIETMWLLKTKQIMG